MLVDDGATIVLGGLITDELRENEQKTPLLGDLPFIGQLFKSSRDDVVKQNLMVFLRPTIMKTPDRRRQKSRTNASTTCARSRSTMSPASPIFIRATKGLYGMNGMG